MGWRRIDDAFHTHPKVRAIPRGERLRAVGLWTLAGCWVSQNLTDGHVPDDQLASFGGTARDVNALTTVGLWVPAEGGYDFMHWTEWNPSRVEVMDRRAAAIKRAAEWRRRRQEED